jgi:molybdopterin molybdotransferase
MISVEEATARIAGALGPTGTETIPIGEAAGRVLVAEASARCNQPPAPVSAMDGYALHAADVASVPARLHVIGSSPAGHPFAGTVDSGKAVRIFTGAVVPDGADAIVIQENTESDGAQVVVKTSAQAGQHIRPKGQDFRIGDTLAVAGRRLSPRDVSLLAAGDIASVTVRRKPVVVLAATGDELSRPGEPRKPGGIVASSGYALAPMIESWGGISRDLGILPDTEDAIGAIASSAKDADIIVTLGGASVGDHDLIQKALGPKGFALDFWKIAVRPGKPLIFGRLGTKPLLGLPGNPVSSFVCAVLFLRPAIAALLGAATESSLLSAKLITPLKANDSRQDYLRARTRLRDGELWVEAFTVQDSSMLRSLAQADALIVRPPHAGAAQAGERVEVLPLP